MAYKTKINNCNSKAIIVDHLTQRFTLNKTIKNEKYTSNKQKIENMKNEK